MQFSSTSFRNTCYGILGLLAIVIMVSTFSIKNNIINSIFGVKNIKAYSNQQEYTPWNNREGFTVREGYSFNTDKDNDKEDSVTECIQRKLSALKTELGNSEGIDDIKKILKDSKQICDYEATKSMMNLISTNKTTKSVDLENILNDSDNKDCIRCKDYTELSDNLKKLIDSI